jgi:putative protease
VKPAGGPTAPAAIGAHPELLAPAGDRDCLRAAVAAGADAVYFGLREFSARSRAANFAPEELPEVMGYLRDHNVRGYLAMNTLVFSDELPRAAELIRLIAAAGPSAVIVQDLGLARLIRRMVPTLAIHASTQMTLTDARAIELARRELGIARVILPRELSLQQVRQIARATAAELEVFVHGALCIAYGGQCLASLALGGRSANRGECAQPCRLPYELRAAGDMDRKPPAQPADRSVSPEPRRARPYPLSPKDLAAWELLPELVRIGVRGFKIEGRLKGAPYVRAATGFYRRALDAALAGRPFEPSREELADLTQSFSRGFTRGFLAGTDHQDLVEGRSPKPQGLRVGTVVGRTARGVVVELEEALKPGDGVVFVEAKGKDPVLRDEQGGRIRAVKPGPGPNVELAFARGSINLAAVAVGSSVWKTGDPALTRRIRAGGEPARRAALAIEVQARAGGALRLTVRDAAGREARVSWPGPLRTAEKHPLTAALLREQLGRLGGTPFELGAVDAGDVDPVMVPKSVLNGLRREAVAKLLALRAAGARRELAEPDALEALRGAPRPPSPGAGDRDVSWSVLVRTAEQLKAALDWRPALVYGDPGDAGQYAKIVTTARASGQAVALATPRIIEPGEETPLRRIAECAPDAVLVRSSAALAFFLEQAPAPALVGDFALNAANELAAGLLAGLGLARLTPAADADWPQLRRMLARADPAIFEVVAYGHPPMFHVKHCVLAASRGRGRDCRDCGAPCRTARAELRDRKGVAHPVLADGLGRSTVFHGEARSAAGLLPAMRAAGIRHFRVELLNESAAQTAALLADCTKWS